MEGSRRLDQRPGGPQVVVCQLQRWALPPPPPPPAPAGQAAKHREVIQQHTLKAAAAACGGGPAPCNAEYVALKHERETLGASKQAGELWLDGAAVGHAVVHFEQASD